MKTTTAIIGHARLLPPVRIVRVFRGRPRLPTSFRPSGVKQNARPGHRPSRFLIRAIRVIRGQTLQSSNLQSSSHRAPGPNPSGSRLQATPTSRKKTAGVGAGRHSGNSGCRRGRRYYWLSSAAAPPRALRACFLQARARGGGACSARPPTRAGWPAEPRSRRYATRP